MTSPKIKGYSNNGKPIITVCSICSLAESEDGWEKYENRGELESHGLCGKCSEECRKSLDTVQKRNIPAIYQVKWLAAVNREEA